LTTELIVNTGSYLLGNTLALAGEVSERIWYNLGRDAMKVFSNLLFHKDIQFRAHIPAGPKILVVNHPTTMDPAMLTTLFDEQVSILILETVFRVPLFGPSVRLSGHICVDYENGKAAIEEGMRYLKAGRTISVFPEGLISPLTGGMHRSRTGAARLAVGSGVPVIPVGIAVDRSRMRVKETLVKGHTEVSTWVFSGPYAMTVGEPLRFKGDVDDYDHVRSVADRIHSHIQAMATESEDRLLSTGFNTARAAANIA
jgi:1-acyl-sn-glycerol-3-phosphate acyltransferase